MVLRSSLTTLIFSVSLHTGLQLSANAAQKPDSEPVAASLEPQGLQLQNDFIGAKASFEAAKLSSLAILDRLHGTELQVNVTFAILLKNGTIYNSGDLAIIGRP